MTYLFVLFGGTDWFVWALAAWQKGRRSEGSSLAEPTATARCHFLPLVFRRCGLRAFPGQAAQAFGALSLLRAASARGPGPGGHSGSAASPPWGQRWPAAESCAGSGCSFTRHVGCRGWRWGGRGVLEGLRGWSGGILARHLATRETIPPPTPPEAFLSPVPADLGSLGPWALSCRPHVTVLMLPGTECRAPER